MILQPKIDSTLDRPWEARISNEAVLQATERDWETWFALLDRAKAQDMPHTAIAAYLSEGGFLTQPDWWAQMIAVAYEQRIGRREPGQNCYGEHNATASRTLAASMDETLAAWQIVVAGALEFDGVAVVKEPTVSVTPKWRYWRASLTDGSKINVNISAKGEGRTLLQIEHRNVGNSTVAEGWKAFWKSRIADVAIGGLRQARQSVTSWRLPFEGGRGSAIPDRREACYRVF